MTAVVTKELLEFQDKILDWPKVMAGGVAVKDRITGGVDVGMTTGLLTLMVTWAVAVPPLPVAVKV